MPELFIPPAPTRTVLKPRIATPSPTPARRNIAKPIPEPPIEGEIAKLPYVARMVAEVLLLRDPQEARRYVRHINNIGS